MSRRGKWATAATAFSALSTALAGFAYVHRGDGVAYSGGAEFSAILCGLVLLCSLALLLTRPWIRIVSVGLGLILTGSLAGAATAAYFLNTWGVLACLGLSALAWLVFSFTRQGRPSSKLEAAA